MMSDSRLLFGFELVQALSRFQLVHFVVPQVVSVLVRFHAFRGRRRGGGQHTRRAGNGKIYVARRSPAQRGPFGRQTRQHTAHDGQYFARKPHSTCETDFRTPTLSVAKDTVLLFDGGR